MFLSPAQYLLLAIVAFFIYSALKKYFRKESKLNDLVLPLVFWLVAGMVIIFPGTAQSIANAIGIGRGVDLIIYVGLLTIFYFVLYLLNKQKETDERLTKLTRELALKNPNDNSKNPSAS